MEDHLQWSLAAIEMRTDRLGNVSIAVDLMPNDPDESRLSQEDMLSDHSATSMSSCFAAIMIAVRCRLVNSLASNVANSSVINCLSSARRA